MKIKYYLYLILLLLTIVPITLFGLHMIQLNSDHVENIMSENLKIVSDSYITDIQNFCSGINDNMEVFCELATVKELIKEENLSTYDYLNRIYLENLVSTQVKINKYVESITIVNKDFDIVVCSTTHKNKKATELEESKFDFTDGILQLSNIMKVNYGRGEKEIIAAVRAIYSDRELIGYIVEEINLDFFEQLRKGAGLWEEGTLYLIDGNNKLITAGTSDEESRKNFVLNEQERAAFTEEWEKIDLSKEPKGEIDYEISKKRYISYYAMMNYSDWHIVVSIAIGRYQEMRESYRMLIIATGGTLIVLLIITNYFISFKIVEPIRIVRETLLKIREGTKYNLRIKVKNHDELGELAEEINGLLECIEAENLKEKEKQSYLRDMAEKDSLTEVFNKGTVTALLNKMVDEAKEKKAAVAILFIDVDNFKDFNTKYGHTVGDQVLEFVAAILEDDIGGIVGRAGGDEFIIGLNQLEKIEDLNNRLKKVCMKLNMKFMVEGTNVRICVPCSFGVAVSMTGQCSYEELMEQADKAMYMVKKKGKNGYHIIEI